MPSNPPKPPGTPDVDLTESGNIGVVNDVIFQTGQVQSAGTGVFNTFVQIQHNGTEQGYNSDNSNEQFDEKNAHHRSLLLANVPVVIGDGTNGTVEGVAYRQFLLDLNEPGAAKQFLSLDKLQIWQEESGSLGNFSSGLGFAGAHTNYLTYDLDAGADRWIGLSDGLSHGSGQSDVAILIPDSFFINDTAHRYVYLYSAFGSQSGWAAEGGFEEWGVAHAIGAPGTTAALNVAKTASVPGGTADHAGEVITYTIQLYNVGDKKLTGITMTDASVSDLTRGADIVGNNDNFLDVGETWSFTAHHTVTQSEIDGNGGGTGQITNTATADSSETGPVSASTSIEIVQGSHAVLVKLASVLDGTADAAGDLISYAFALTNDGVTTLTNPVVTDSMITSQTPILNGSAPIVNPNAQIFIPVLDGDFNLGDTNQNGVADAGETFQFVYPGDITNDGIHDPGETWSAINLGDANNDGIHQVGEIWVGDTNQNGVEDAGERWQFKNVGDTNHNNLQDAGETWQYLNVGDTNQNGAQDAGETFQYFNVGDTNRNGLQDAGETFQFYNAGDTNQNGVEDSGETFQFVVSHEVAGVDTNNDGFNDGDANHDGVLNVGETWQFAFTHTLTQAEIDNGGIVDPGLTIDNTATASTNQVVSIATASASVPVVQDPDLEIHKLVSSITSTDHVVGTTTVDAAGDVINYTVTVENTGNMTLTSVTVVDPLLGTLSGPSGDNGNGLLDVGETWTYSGSYTVQQADIDNGGVVDPGLAINNTATADSAQTLPETASASVPVIQDPDLEIHKLVSSITSTDLAVGTTTVDAAGDVINYTVTVANTGNMTLTSVTVVDPLLGTLSGPSGDNGNGLLDLGETWTYSGSYTVQQADIDNGGVVDPGLAINNTATADSAQTLPETASASVAVEQQPDVELAKSADVTSVDAAGDVINYAITVHNSGNMALTNPVVSDAFVSNLAAVDADIDGFNDGDTNHDGKLSLDETWQYTASHTVTQAEIDAGGSIANTASVITDQGATASGGASVTVEPPPPAAMSLDMSLSMWVDGNENGHGDASGQDLIQFALVLENHSGDTLTNIAVSDFLGGRGGGPFQTPVPASLAPHGSAGDSWQSTYNHFLTASDVAAGQASDDVTITALDSHGHTQTIMAHWDAFFPV